jgi:hypothetical protein
MTSASPSAAQMEVVAGLKSAISSKDAAKVEAALGDVLDAGVDLGCSELQGRMCSLLISLLEAAWHSEHGVVAACIGAFRCAQAIPALEKAANASMASNDVYCKLARICFLALADIGTPDARAALERLPTMP